ncbi:hypothetical protein BDN70DRAFT_888251 [Pholiota conissans]|uniref:Uncharacterized protein n=1 Tax=Pholiota conissans TaxID=109636 RepID=A0A9P5YK70_9AGAR|nr:hypothetical protein BDN70DRAFT_888251 [Pholiota conissans]
MDNSSSVALPNPNTPLAFLDPESAYQTSVSIYVLAGSLGVLLWDVLDNIGSDFNLLFRNRVTFSTLVYFMSRLGSLGYVIASNIFETAPTGHCKAFETITDAFYPVSLGLSALLFFIRLRAIYNRDRIVVAFFFLLWLGLLGTTMIVPITILGGNIGPTQYCIDEDVPNAVYAAIISPLVHDTLVFIAITYRLVRNAHLETGLKDGMAVAFSGEYLPAFSKGLLKDGQKYYLISLISNLVTVIMVFDTSVPVPMRSMCATPNIVLTNIMACRVYRNTRRGFIRESEISTTSMMAFRKKKPVSVSFPHFDGSNKRPIAVEVSYDVPLSDITTKVDGASSRHIASTKHERMAESKETRSFGSGDVESQS